jgi:hypothetical protein
VGHLQTVGMGTASHRFRLGWLSPSRGGISFKPWPWGGLWAVVRCPAGTHLRKEKKKKISVDFGKKISLYRISFDIYNYFFLIFFFFFFSEIIYLELLIKIIFIKKKKINVNVIQR